MKKQQKVAIGVGAGVAALAAASAAAMYFTGKKGKARRAKVSKWAIDAKKDVIKQLKSAQNVTKKSFESAVDTVMDQYKKAKKVDPGELLALAGELKGHWDNIVKEASTATKKVVPAKVRNAVKKSVSKAKKSVVKKAPAKKTTKRKAK